MEFLLRRDLYEDIKHNKKNSLLTAYIFSDINPFIRHTGPRLLSYRIIPLKVALHFISRMENLSGRKKNDVGLLFEDP